MELIIGVVIGVVTAAVVLVIFRTRLLKSADEKGQELVQSVEVKLQAMLPGVMKQTSEHIMLLANEKLGAEKREMRTDMENKRSEIERMIKTLQQELKSSQDNLVKSEKERVGSYMALKNQLEEYKQITQQLKVTTEGLKTALSNNQLRGQFGEKVAEDLLRMIGFVKGVDYIFNQAQTEASTRPDFTIYLPDKSAVNVDVKFPYMNLQRMIETADEAEKKTYLKQFERDVKEKIKQVAGREYINRDDNTVEFVILFIPNEMIFSFIYDRFDDLVSLAMEKKVILAGPFSFTAILRMVRQSYNSFHYQNNVMKIINHINDFESEFVKYNEEFVKIGERIKSLESQYSRVDQTRTGKLVKIVEKVRLEAPNEDKDQQEELKLISD